MVEPIAKQVGNVGVGVHIADVALAVESMAMVRALVTGGSRGLGFEVARALAAQNVEVTILGQDHERVTKATAQINAEINSVNGEDNVSSSSGENIGGEKSAVSRSHVLGITCDVRDYDALNEIAASHQPFDLLVLSHGVMSEKMSKTMKATKEDWDRTVDINLNGVFNVVNIFGKDLIENRSGRIIVFSACLGRMSGPGSAGGLAPYRISKAGVNSFVRNLAHETGLGARGVLVDAICPGHCRTDMGGPDAPRSAAEGAQTAIWLATRSFTPGVDQTGLLWEDNEIVPW